MGIEIASLQSSFITLDEVIKITSRRVNALEHIVLPRYRTVVAYIITELDEMAREERFTTKKVLQNKEKQALEELADKEREMAKKKSKGEPVGDEEGGMVDEKRSDGGDDDGD